MKFKEIRLRGKIKWKKMVLLDAYEKTNIWKEEKYRNIQGTYPVIFISFKGVKYDTWKQSYAQFKSILKNEVNRTLTPLLDKLPPIEKKHYEQLMDFIPFFIR